MTLPVSVTIGVVSSGPMPVGARDFPTEDVLGVAVGLLMPSRGLAGYMAVIHHVYGSGFTFQYDGAIGVGVVREVALQHPALAADALAPDLRAVIKRLNRAKAHAVRGVLVGFARRVERGLGPTLTLVPHPGRRCPAQLRAGGLCGRPAVPGRYGCYMHVTGADIGAAGEGTAS